MQTSLEGYEWQAAIAELVAEGAAPPRNNVAKSNSSNQVHICFQTAKELFLGFLGGTCRCNKSCEHRRQYCRSSPCIMQFRYDSYHMNKETPLVKKSGQDVSSFNARSITLKHRLGLFCQEACF